MENQGTTIYLNSMRFNITCWLKLFIWVKCVLCGILLVANNSLHAILAGCVSLCIWNINIHQHTHVGWNYLSLFKQQRRWEARGICLYITEPAYSPGSNLCGSPWALEQRGEVRDVCMGSVKVGKKNDNSRSASRGRKTDFCCTQNRCSGWKWRRGNTSRVNNLKRLQAAEKFVLQQHT
jgi:hypothetical protein